MDAIFLDWFSETERWCFLILPTRIFHLLNFDRSHLRASIHGALRSCRKKTFSVSCISKFLCWEAVKNFKRCCARSREFAHCQMEKETFFLGQLLPRKNRNPKSENRLLRQPLKRDVRTSEIGRFKPSWERCSWGALLKRAL